MDTLGDHLREKRKEKGLSLEEISARTKVGLRYLQALEENDFAKIPSEVLAKGFLRAYAKVLSLTEKEVLAMFHQQAEPVYGKHTLSLTGPSPLGRPEKKGPASSLRLAAALGILIIAGVLFVSPRQKTPLQEEPHKQPSAGVGIEGGEKIPAVQKGLEEAVNPPGEAKAPLRLSITALEDTWVLAQSDDLRNREALLHPGDKVTWQAPEWFRVTLGNAGGVTIEINGTPVHPLGRRGEVVRNVLLTREK